MRLPLMTLDHTSTAAMKINEVMAITRTLWTNRRPLRCRLQGAVLHSLLLRIPAVLSQTQHVPGKSVEHITNVTNLAFNWN